MRRIVVLLGGERDAPPVRKSRPMVGDRKGRIMRNVAKLLIGATLLAAATAPSAAQLLTVEVRARVTDVYDSSNVLGGAVTVGQLVTGSYTYDVNAPDQDGSLNGFYRQPEGSVKL